MAGFSLAYGNKETIPQAIAENKIPFNTLILTNDSDELFFYDNNGILRTYQEKKKFSSSKEAQDWVDKYGCQGNIITIHENNVCKAYIVNYDGKLEPLAGEPIDPSDTDSGKGAIIVKVSGSVEDVNEKLSSIIPAEGEQYIVEYSNIEATDYSADKDEEGNYPIIITDTVRYRMKIGDGVTSLADLPIISSNLQAGEGSGSLIQIDPTYDNGKDSPSSPAQATAPLAVAFGTHSAVHAKDAMAVNYNNLINLGATRSFACIANNIINGSQSFAAGLSNIIDGNSSLTLGLSNHSKANGQKLIGTGLTSSVVSQLLLGIYNKEDDDALVIIGNGTTANQRRNAIVVKRDNSIELAGKLFTPDRLNYLSGILNTTTISVHLHSVLPAQVTCSNGTVNLNGVDDYIYTEIDGVNMFDHKVIRFYNVPCGQWEIKVSYKDNLKTITHNRIIVVNNTDTEIGIHDSSSIPDNFADASLVDIVCACECNAVPDTWKVGDENKLTLDTVDYPVVIIGMNVDEISSSGRLAPLTLQFKDVYTELWMNQSIGDAGAYWSTSYMKNIYLRDLLKKFPPILLNSIPAISKSTFEGSDTGAKYVSSDEFLFLISTEELDPNQSSSAKYTEYYSDQSKRIKYLNSKAVGWYLRDRYSDSKPDAFSMIAATGSFNYSTESTKRGISPAFCVGPKYTVGDKTKLHIGNTTLTEDQLNKLLKLI